MPENGTFFKHPPEENQKSDWLVSPLIKTNRQVISGAYPGEGKSFITHILSYCVAYDSPFGDIFGVTPGNVLLIDSENKWDILKDRTDKIKKGLELDGHSKQHRIWWEPYPNLLLEDESTWEPILKIIDDVKPIMITLDHLRAFHLLSEDKSDQMKKVNKGLQALQTRQGSTLIINHHFNKSDVKGSFLRRLRGSSALLADTDTAYEIRALSRKRIGDIVRLEKIGIIFQPRKEQTPAPMIMQLEEGKDYMKLHYEADYQPVSDPRLDELSHKLYHLFLDNRDVWSVKDIESRIAGFADMRELRQCLHFMEHSLELITSTRKGSTGGKFQYSLKPTDTKIVTCPWCKIVV